MNGSAHPSKDSTRRVSRRQFLAEAAGGAALGVVGAHAGPASAVRTTNALPQASPAQAALLRVDAAPDRAVNSFDPDLAFCSSMDILSASEIDKVYTPENVKKWLSAGWGAISYRNNTELRMMAWHWNPKGTWSDAANQSGYFVGDLAPTEFVRRSFGYALPHMGGYGDNNSGYSRVTDGDPTTFWKSNPYLAQAFTHEDDELHPQWIVIDLGVEEAVNAIRLDWREPSAKAYDIEYWTGEDPMNWEADYSPGGPGVGRQIAGQWNRFPKGAIRDGKGGRANIQLADTPVRTRWLRVLMTQSNNRPGPHGDGDIRHRVGYALQEVYAGTLQEDGTFIDLITHAPDARQTTTYCSSVDPWHSAADLVPERVQTGFDLFFTSGITNQLPAMIPVAVLYSTPEDAAAQVAYLKNRGYPVAWIEMGEECDGRYTMPEDYAALYLQFAAAIHRVDPSLKLGGPVFQGVTQDISTWPDAQGRTSWFARFLGYLDAHGRLPDLGFLSFEHYPFDPRACIWSDLFRESELTRNVLDAWRKDGLPSVPMMITESNVSWALTENMVEVFAALWLAESVGSFFLNGGALYVHSPIQAEPLRRGVRGWGTFGNFVADENLNVLQYTAQYFASRMINLEWVKHRSGLHILFRVSGGVKDAAGRDLLSAYAVKGPDGEWSLLLINRDPGNAREVQIEFDDQPSGKQSRFQGPVRMVTFGSEQYVWHSKGAQSHADPDGPPSVRSFEVTGDKIFALPKASITVLRGTVSGI